MGINRVSRGKAGTPSATGAGSAVETFAVKRAEPPASAAPAFESAPVSERVVESTRHLRGLLPEADLQMIRETLEDKLDADPMFVDMLHRVGGGGGR
jgi:hypothetical protein